MATQSPPNETMAQGIITDCTDDSLARKIPVVISSIDANTMPNGAAAMKKITIKPPTAIMFWAEE